MKNNNIDLISKINSIILYKKFDSFYKKHADILSTKNMKKLFYKDFGVQDNLSTEYILFLEYLIIK